MKHTLLVAILFIISLPLLSQTGYTGFIGKYPVELNVYFYSDKEAEAVYTYTKFDEPIKVAGKRQKNKMTFFEKDANGKNKATLTFDNLTAQSDTAKGVYTNLATGVKLAITLARMFSVDENKNPDQKEVEILQPASQSNQYFKLIVSTSTSGSYKNVTGIKIMEKKTDRLIQRIDLDCQLIGLDDVSIGDYNFDGVSDFSVFESSYAGPNTSSLYFLCDPKTNQYFESGFTGTSLEFDSKKKRIYESNQCCAGTSVVNAEYKVINNKMVLIKQHCFKWDDKKQELVERSIKDCQ